MRDRCFGSAESADLLKTEVNTVGDPGLRAEPSAVFKIVNRSLAELFFTELILIDSFTQMRMKTDM